MGKHNFVDTTKHRFLSEALEADAAHQGMGCPVKRKGGKHTKANAEQQTQQTANGSAKQKPNRGECGNVIERHLASQAA